MGVQLGPEILQYGTLLSGMVGFASILGLLEWILSILTIHFLTFHELQNGIDTHSDSSLKKESGSTQVQDSCISDQCLFTHSDCNDCTYPLVHVYTTMEKITIFHGKIHYKWWSSIVMLNYQRVVASILFLYIAYPGSFAPSLVHKA